MPAVRFAAAGFASLAGSRAQANRRAAGDVRPLSAEPGRATTQIGTSRMISCQPRQRWKVARLSAPISQTKRTAG